MATCRAACDLRLIAILFTWGVLEKIDDATNGCVACALFFICPVTIVQGSRSHRALC